MSPWLKHEGPWQPVHSCSRLVGPGGLKPMKVDHLVGLLQKGQPWPWRHR